MCKLKRMWINQPTDHHPGCKVWPANVLVDFSDNPHPEVATVYFLNGSVISQRMIKLALHEGWFAQ